MQKGQQNERTVDLTLTLSVDLLLRVMEVK